MTGEDYTKAFLAGNEAAFNSLLAEIEREGYETVAQIKGSIHGFIEINKGLSGDINE